MSIFLDKKTKIWSIRNLFPWVNKQENPTNFINVPRHLVLDTLTETLKEANGKIPESYGFLKEIDGYTFEIFDKEFAHILSISPSTDVLSPTPVITKLLNREFFMGDLSILKWSGKMASSTRKIASGVFEDIEVLDKKGDNSGEWKSYSVDSLAPLYIMSNKSLSHILIGYILKIKDKRNNRYTWSDSKTSKYNQEITIKAIDSATEIHKRFFALYGEDEPTQEMWKNRVGLKLQKEPLATLK